MLVPVVLMVSILQHPLHQQMDQMVVIRLVLAKLLMVVEEVLDLLVEVNLLMLLVVVLVETLLQLLVLAVHKDIMEELVVVRDVRVQAVAAEQVVTLLIMVLMVDLVLVHPIVKEGEMVDLV
tara:strand:+ start:202 stop:567 length:366 start_codon:yes stop_codon:yes gene_type:complete